MKAGWTHRQHLSWHSPPSPAKLRQHDGKAVTNETQKGVNCSWQLKGTKRSDYNSQQGLTCFTLNPDFALVSTNMTFSSFAFFSPSSVATCRLSCRSVLLPTNIMITSFPRSVRTSSIHFDVWWNELASAKGFVHQIMMESNRELEWHHKQSTRRGTYWWCHRRRLRRWSLWCNWESVIGTSPDPRCPITAASPSDPPDTWSWRGSQSRSLPDTCCRTYHTWIEWWEKFCRLREWDTSEGKGK